MIRFNHDHYDHYVRTMTRCSGLLFIALLATAACDHGQDTGNVAASAGSDGARTHDELPATAYGIKRGVRGLGLQPGQRGDNDGSGGSSWNDEPSGAGIAGKAASAGGADGGSSSVSACQSSSGCCIEGKQYAQGVPNPETLCEICDPESSIEMFSAAADDSSCGDGCICRAGTGIEIQCSDAADNDQDNAASCADVDCAGQICRPGSLDIPFSSVATRDVAEYGTNEGLVQEDSTQTIIVSSNPRGERVAILEFGDVPTDPAIAVLKATLWIYVESGGKPLRIFDADGNELESPDAPAEAGPRAFDVSSLVKAWVSNGESRRFIKLRYGSARGFVALRATEYAQAADAPRLDIFYEAVCDPNGVCPLPSMTATPR